MSNIKILYKYLRKVHNRKWHNAICFYFLRMVTLFKFIRHEILLLYPFIVDLLHFYSSKSSIGWLVFEFVLTEMINTLLALLKVASIVFCIFHEASSTNFYIN